MRRIMLLVLGILLLTVSCPTDKEPANEETAEEDTDEEDQRTKIETAAEVVRNMGLGVNIGNSFDSLNTTNIATETGWGNPQISQSYIKSLKVHGFNTVRFPVSWADYIGPAPDYTVSNTWMERVARVVDWILAEDMYCILNVHHDGADIEKKSWIEEARFPEQEAEVKAKFTALWYQIAVRFSDCSDKLIFESMNEPQFDKLWPRNSSNEANKTKAFRLLTDLNQIFLDTVRGASGNNASRFLLISSYWTDIDININNWDTFFFMPNDTKQDRLILSFHYYTPWNFCGGNSQTWTNTAQLDTQFNKVKDNFLDKGIPVIIGEYGVNITTNGQPGGTLKDPTHRADWLLAVTQKCVDLGICPILWDTGMRANNMGMADVQRSSPFGISDNLRTVLESVVWPEAQTE